MSSDDHKLIETMLRSILAEKASDQTAALKEMISKIIRDEFETIKEAQANELFLVNLNINKIIMGINDLALTAKGSVTKTPKTPSSRQGTPAGKTEGAAATTEVVPTKINIMQYAKQELVRNPELLKEYETKIDEKNPGQTDIIKKLDIVVKKKDEGERLKAYVSEVYKHIKENNEDLAKDLRARLDKWKGDQQKEEHPVKLNETGSTD